MARSQLLPRPVGTCLSHKRSAIRQQIGKGWSGRPTTPIVTRTCTFYGEGPLSGKVGESGEIIDGTLDSGHVQEHEIVLDVRGCGGFKGGQLLCEASHAVALAPLV